MFDKVIQKVSPGTSRQPRRANGNAETYLILESVMLCMRK